MIPSPDDRLLHQLGRLGPVEPDEAHAASIRVQCRRQLERRRLGPATRARRPARAGDAASRRTGADRRLAAVALGALSLGYLALVVGDALAAYGLL